MKKYSKLVLLTILFLTVGFAAVNTVLDINGKISFAQNEEDFSVYFYNVKKNNITVNEVISEDKKQITVNISDLLTVGDTAVYNYTVANTSKNYDAKVDIECTTPTNESISLTNTFLNTTIIAGTKAAGTLTLEYLSETSEITEYTCTLNVEAIERTSLGDEFIEEFIVNLNANGGNLDTTSLKVIKGEKYGELPIPTQTYYDFVGWFTEESGGTQITSDTIVDISDDQTLYAQYQKITTPILTGGNGDWTTSTVNISVQTPGTAYSGVQYYEYIISRDNVCPLDNATISGATSNNLAISQGGISYIFYRTLSNQGNHSEWSAAQVVKIQVNLYYYGNEYTSLTGGWYQASASPHNVTTILTNTLKKNTNNLFHQVTSIWTASNLTTRNSIDMKYHNSLCFYTIHYIPMQERTGQGVYYGTTTSNNITAASAQYLPEVQAQVLSEYCQDISGITGSVHPFIEVYNAHTAIPYTGWVANSYVAVYHVYLR